MVKLNIVNNGIVYIPYNENLPTIEVTEEELIKLQNGLLIYKNGKIIDNSERIKAQQEITELKQKLADTDYISNKLAEAVSKYIATGDNAEVVELRTKYSKQLEDRQLWRDRINELEQLFLKNQNG